MTSTIFQVSEAAMAASRVFSRATDAIASAAHADPALKPIQPTSSRDAPIMVRTGLWATMGLTP